MGIKKDTRAMKEAIRLMMMPPLFAGIKNNTRATKEARRGKQRSLTSHITRVLK